MTNLFLKRLREEGVLSSLDLHFARFMERLSGQSNPELLTAAALTSSFTRAGNICLDLSNLYGSPLTIPLPEKSSWWESLRESGVVGAPGEFKPLILDEAARLYLFRYWDYQTRLALSVKSRVQQPDMSVNKEALKDGLVRLFPQEQKEEVDWPRVAALTALMKRFTVISGGPGTGKTTLVAKILALLLEAAGPVKLRIGLVSPTGKGASRLEEAIRRAKATLPCEEKVRQAIPEEASTIHRLLGSIPGSPYFRHHSENLLPLDVLIVDEASMVDLALMSKLIQALPTHSRLILLGDKDQLASVEAGAVLADICEAGESLAFSKNFAHEVELMTGCDLGQEEANGEAPSIRDCIVYLKKSYRFGFESGIAAAGRAVNDGKGDLALEIMEHGGHKDIAWKDIRLLYEQPLLMKEMAIKGFSGLPRAANPREGFQALDEFKILCGLREGPYGANSLNTVAERILRNAKLIEREGEWYGGRPVLITRNDYGLRLYNGDVGIVLPDEEEGSELRVFFQTSDRETRKLNPLRMPEHENMFAVTVHKSQGSEFSEVLLILPDRDSPVLTRELIYTAITRARERVEIWGDREVLRKAVGRRTARTSGLKDALVSTSHQELP